MYIILKKNIYIYTNFYYLLVCYLFMSDFILTMVDSKSIVVPPTILPFFSASIIKTSVGSLNFLISHHKHLPSVEAEKNSEPDLD